MNKRRKPDAKTNRDVAATLFAKLFYRQVMEEREAKLREKKSKSDGKGKPGVRQI